MRLIKFIASTLGDEYVKRACAVAVQLRIRALLSAKNDRLYFQSLIVQKLNWRFISCEGCRSDALPYVQLLGAHSCDRKSEMEHIESKLHPVILINLCAEQCNFFVVVDVLDLVMLLFF